MHAKVPRVDNQANSPFKHQSSLLTNTNLYQVCKPRRSKLSITQSLFNKLRLAEKKTSMLCCPLKIRIYTMWGSHLKITTKQTLYTEKMFSQAINLLRSSD